MREINSHIIKLTGKAELPEALDMGNNFSVTLQGAINTISHSDNEDGSFNAIYTFKPVLVEVIDNKGETIKAKDTRSKSQLLRARIWKLWRDSGSETSFDSFYDRFMGYITAHTDEIFLQYEDRK